MSGESFSQAIDRLRKALAALGAAQERWRIREKLAEMKAAEVAPRDRVEDGDFLRPVFREEVLDELLAWLAGKPEEKPEPYPPDWEDSDPAREPLLRLEPNSSHPVTVTITSRQPGEFVYIPEDDSQAAGLSWRYVTEGLPDAGLAVIFWWWDGERITVDSGRYVDGTAEAIEGWNWIARNGRRADGEVYAWMELPIVLPSALVTQEAPHG